MVNLGVMRRGASPLVTGTSPQTARLRPLRNPLTDTEKCVAATPYTKLEFFVNRRTFLDGTPKRENHNNMTSDGQLGSPLEFDFIGLTGKPNYGISLVNWNALYNAGVLRWLFHQNVQWLNVKLTELPSGIAPTGFTTETTSSILANGQQNVNNFYNMADHLKNARHIMPLENFKGIIDFPVAFQPAVSDVYFSIHMLGLLYGAL